jgi:hypothetical protein
MGISWSTGDKVKCAFNLKVMCGITSSLLEFLSNNQQIDSSDRNMPRYTIRSCDYLELSKGHLLLDTEAWNFIMINKIKIYVFPYLSF